MNNGSSVFGSDWLGAFLIIAILFGGGFGLGGRGPQENVSEVVNNAVNNQSTQQGLQQVLLSSANNNYETAQLISAQTRDLMAQNYTNQINVVQGFNAIQQQIAQLGYQMESCCCSIKTQMLQDRLDDTQRALAVEQAKNSNSEQSQYLLSVMGKWIANPAATAA